MGIDTLNLVRTVVIPVAGLGTRMLPATKVVCKELLPVGRKPLIQYAVEEARASGIERVVFVCRAHDTRPLRHFQSNPELEQNLREHGRMKELEELAAIGRGLSFFAVEQPEPRGLADAIRCAESVVGGEPFGVILPDALILGAKPCLAGLIRCRNRLGGAVVATRSVVPEEISRFGILEIDPEWHDPEQSSLRVLGLVEKPQPEVAPSIYGVYGRYVLPPEIFSWIDRTKPSRAGEVQLTDTLHLFCQNQPVYGVFFEGEHYDAGSWSGFAQATIACFSAAFPQNFSTACAAAETVDVHRACRVFGAR